MRYVAARHTLDALKRRQEALWRRIEREVDTDMRGWKATPAVWSINEIVQHIGLAGHAILGAARPARRAQSPFALVRFLTLRVALKSPLRFRAPVAQVVPTPDVTWEQAVDIARSGLQRWDEYLASSSNPSIFMHPRVGPLTTSRTVTFLSDHFDHHVPQIEKLIQSSPADRRLIWS